MKSLLYLPIFLLALFLSSFFLLQVLIFIISFQFKKLSSVTLLMLGILATDSFGCLSSENILISNIVIILFTNYWFLLQGQITLIGEFQVSSTKEATCLMFRTTYSWWQVSNNNLCCSDHALGRQKIGTTLQLHGFIIFV